MDTDVYRRLQKHLDRLPMGFPQSESGVEMEIIRKLFNPEEAEIACAMDVRPESPIAVAERLGRDPEETREKLMEMSRKGLIFRTERDGETLFSGAAFVVGIYEYQVKRMDKDLAEKKDRYLKEAFFKEWHPKVGASSFSRVMPVGKSITPDLGIKPWEEIRSIVEAQERIAVTDCICRVKAGLLGRPCEKPMETCFAFGAGARFYIENGWAREVSREEALEIIDKCEGEGMVLSPSNAQAPVAMCICCPCCCDVLHSIKRFPKPAMVLNSGFCSEIDPDKCLACETCIERCPMEAIQLSDGSAVVDDGRCIGCGVCVSACPEEAVQLIRREAVVDPPQRIGHLFKQMAVERGKA